MRPIIFLIGIILAIFGFIFFIFFAPNIKSINRNRYLYIRNGDNYQQVLHLIEQKKILRYIPGFDWTARILNYPNNIHPGRYLVLSGMSNFRLIRDLRSGRQIPLRVVINKFRTTEELSKYLSNKIQPDSASFQHLFNNSDFLKKFGCDTNNELCFVIPATYYIYWSSNVESCLRKLFGEYQVFWDSTRRREAANLCLTPIQVMTLASIVEEETNKNEEKPEIASVYINRLKLGMPLDADPTIKFALKNFTLKRISIPLTKVKSPFNTYLNPGLPPGPICTPSKGTIDSVLHSPKTAYLYFCARDDFSGYHDFAKTFKTQEANARKYQEAEDRNNIK